MLRRNGCRRVRAAIGRFHPEVQRRRLDAGAFEQSGERHAGPGRGAHRAEAPLHAGRRWQLEAAAAVAGALQSRRALLAPHAANVLETERDRARHLAVDRQRPRRRHVRRQRKMASDEEQIVSRYERPQRFDRRLRIERPGVTDYQPRCARGRPAAGLCRGSHKFSGMHAAHHRSGGTQSERKRLATADESSVHGTSD